MPPKYDGLHAAVLSVLHALHAGGYGLYGDTNERLLRSWYKQYEKDVEEAASMCETGNVSAGPSPLK